jgi:YD repeat-containing protein
MVAYDNAGNIQTVAKTNDANVTYLWGYNNARPVAQIVNAGLNMVAYSSFESDGKGNWSYAGTPVNTQAAKTGEFYYPLTGGNITRQLPAGKYKLEYWAKGTVNLSGGTITTIRTSSPDANGWTLYEKEVVMGATTTLTVSGGSGAYVDELRVYPTDAQMTTYTYDPLIGITSVTDPSNFTTYYEYDAFGRLMFVKDKDGYVQKMNEYNYRFK